MDNSAFRLQPVMRLREAERDQRRTELAKAYQAEKILQQQIDQVESDVASACESLHTLAAPGVLNVDQMLEGHRYRMLLKLQRQRLAQQKQLLLTEIEKRRLALVEADRQLKMLEKLRERKETEQLEADQKLETRQLDEVALRRYQLPVARSGT